MRRASAPSAGSAPGVSSIAFFAAFSAGLRLLGRLDRAEHRALQARRLALEREELGRVLRLQGLEPEGLDRERLRGAEGRSTPSTRVSNDTL